MFWNITYCPTYHREVKREEQRVRREGSKDQWHWKASPVQISASTVVLAQQNKRKQSHRRSSTLGRLDIVFTAH
jgi:hypothetical protein